MDVKTALPNPAACPPDLRLVLDRWQGNRATDAELIDASYCAQLDLLDEYRWRSLPTAPDELQDFRSLSPSERHSMDGKKKADLCERYRGFLDQESEIQAKNGGNVRHLLELLAWATTTQKPAVILQAIERSIKGHHLHVVEEF